MKVSLKGALEIAEHEGLVPAPYKDSVGVWTYGVGHTTGAGSPNPANMPKGMPKDLEGAIEHAIQLFQKDLKKYEDRVNRAVKVPLKQHQFDALVSFDFNTGGIFRAQLTKSLNKGDYTSAGSKFMGWVKPPEIRKRRSAEMKLFQTGNYDANGDDIPVWKVSKTGRLLGIHSVIDGKDLAKRLTGEKTSPVLVKPPVPNPTTKKEEKAPTQPSQGVSEGITALFVFLASLFKRKRR